tara:strand:- start:26 stop:973 length:948 start_codon:yes stop_codon:yes gene_type:complete
MLSDPLFIVGFIGMAICLISWIKFSIQKNDVEPFVVRYISTISFISGLALLLSIFYNSGDLGIVLLFGSFISFLIMIVGYFLNNTEIVSTSRGYFIPIFIIFILRTFLYEPYQIPSGSMEPQLKKGDFLLVNKFAYGLKVQRVGMPRFLVKDPQYGDPVVIIPKHNPVPYIKRLIGMPGDVIRIINKQIYINGELLERKFIKSEEITLKKRYRLSNGVIETRESDAIGDIYIENIGEASYTIRNTRGENQQYPQEWTVPQGHYFVMGDNRDNSNDSTKDVGFVPRENFFGRADYLWMTWECWLCLPSFEKAGKIN